MAPDRKRKSGFYWVRVHGLEVVADYRGWCVPGVWFLPGVEECIPDRQIDELLYGPIPTPMELLEERAALLARGKKP